MASAPPRTRHDPLEAAKLGTDQVPPAKPPQAEAAAPRPAEPQPTEPGTRRPRFRVVRDHRVSIRGNICNFKAGRVIDSAGYDIDNLNRQGLELEKIEE